METVPVEAVRAWLEQIHANLDELLPHLRSAFPNVHFATFSRSFGSLTEFQGHAVGIEATFSSGDCVALDVSAGYLTTTPRVYGDVSWNPEAPGGVETSTCEDCYHSTEWPVATQRNLDAIERDVPRLVDVFRDAIDRYNRR